MRGSIVSVVVPALTLALSGCVPRLYSPSTDDTDDGTCAWEAPTNPWPSADPGCPTAQGFQPGQVVPDFRLPDQFSNTVAMWQFSGLVTVVDISTMWCAPCQELAESTQEMYDTFKDDGAMILTVLPQDTAGNPPDDADLDMWSEGFGITAPVLGDDGTWTNAAVPDGQYPVLLVVGADLKVREKVVPPTHDNLEAAVERALAE